MKTREKFKRAVIETIHGLPYDEAIKREFRLPITIGRVIEAIRNKQKWSYDKQMFGEHKILTSWKLTKENGKECTDDDQTDETIEKLLNLLTK